MKSVPIKQFYADSSVMNKLSAGEHLAVKSRGKTEFIVIKGGQPRMTEAIAEQRAIGNAKGPKFDGVAFLKSLKK